MGILLTIVLGMLVGWLATVVTKTDSQFGWLANLLIGVLGAFVGDVLGGLFNLGDASLTWDFWSLVMSFIGAVVSLLIFIQVRKRSNY